jgi:hypothetical protein
MRPATAPFTESNVEPLAADVVRTALSRLLCESRSRNSPQVDQVNDMLARYGCVGVKQSPPPLAGREPMPAREAKGVMRRHGFDRRTLDGLWADATQAGELLPRIPDSVLEAFFPPTTWDVALALLWDGPAIAGARTERAINLEARRRLRPTRARPDGGTPSRGRLLTLVAGVRRLMAIYCELRTVSDAACLRSWVSIPKPPRVVGEAQTTDRSAPPRYVLRDAWQRAEAEVRDRLGAAPEQELAVIRHLSAGQLRSAGLHRAMRDRSLLLLFVVLGGRSDAIRSLRLGDFCLDRRSPDGRVGPAIALRPGKNASVTGEIHWKPIPQPAADRLAAYVALCDVLIPQRRTDDDPLLIGTLPSYHRPISAAAVYGIFAGRPAGRVPATPGLVLTASPTTEGAWAGYSPHRLRRAASQLTLHGARQAWRDAELEIDPETLADELLDHRIEKDRLGYFDLNTREAREHWSGIATQINWEMLTTDRGARRSIDVVAYGKALREQDALRRALEQLRSRIDALLQPTDAGPTDPLEALSRAAANQLHAYAALREERRIEDLLRERTAEIERLLHDPHRRVAIPDDSPPGAEYPDLESVEREALGGQTRAEHDSPRRRDWITVAELALIQGVGEATARRWVAGTVMPFRDGDPRNPWPRGCAPVAPGSSERRKRLSAKGINPLFFDSERKRDALEKALRHWPAGWTPDVEASR